MIPQTRWGCKLSNSVKHMKRVVRSAFGLAAGIVLGSGTNFGAGGAAVAPTGKSEAKNPAVAWESLPSIRTGVKIWAHTSKSALNCTIMD